MRSLLLVLMVSLAAPLTGCQAVADFDRTKIPGADAPGKLDAGNDDDSDSGKEDAASTPIEDAATNPQTDANDVGDDAGDSDDAG